MNSYKIQTLVVSNCLLFCLASKRAKGIDLFYSFTGIDFTKRLPCGEVERARRSIRTFFKLRQLSLDIQGHLETKLPLSSPDSCVQVQDVLDLNNSDLLAVTVTSKQPPGASGASGSRASGSSGKWYYFLFCLYLGYFSLVFGTVRSAVIHLQPNLSI